MHSNLHKPACDYHQTKYLYLHVFTIMYKGLLLCVKDYYYILSRVLNIKKPLKVCTFIKKKDKRCRWCRARIIFWTKKPVHGVSPLPRMQQQPGIVNDPSAGSPTEFLYDSYSILYFLNYPISLYWKGLLELWHWHESVQQIASYGNYGQCFE